MNNGCTLGGGGPINNNEGPRSKGNEKQSCREEGALQNGWVEVGGYKEATTQGLFWGFVFFWSGCGVVVHRGQKKKSRKKKKRSRRRVSGVKKRGWTTNDKSAN